jgi:hypothetical protein
VHWARVAPAISVTSRWRRAGPVSFVSRGHGPWDRECFYVLCACAVRVCIIHIRRISACGSFHLHVHVHVRTPSRRADSATQWPATTAQRTLQLSRDARPVPGDARPGAARPDDTLETTRHVPHRGPRPARARPHVPGALKHVHSCRGASISPVALGGRRGTLTLVVAALRQQRKPLFARCLPELGLRMSKAVGDAKKRVPHRLAATAVHLPYCSARDAHNTCACACGMWHVHVACGMCMCMCGMWHVHVHGHVHGYSSQRSAVRAAAAELLAARKNGADAESARAWNARIPHA